MKNKWVFVSAAATALFLTAPARAQPEHTHAHGEGDKLGTVDFKTSCRPEVAAAFTRATALLHSFGYATASAPTSRPPLPSTGRPTRARGPRPSGRPWKTWSAAFPRTTRPRSSTP